VLIDAARNANSSGIAFLTQDRSLFKRFLTNPNPSATLNHAQGFVFMCPLVPDAVASWLLPRRCPFQSYMTTPSIYIRIDQLPVGSNSRFEAQLVIGDDETGQVAGFKSPVFESEDEHEPFVGMMQRITQALLQVRDFKKRATVEDLHILNKQSQEVKPNDAPLIIMP
jgi:hypothetical protein